MSFCLSIIVLSLLCIIPSCVCDICSTCLCSDTDVGPIINCHEKHLGSNDILNVDLLMLDEHQMLNELILSKNDIMNLPGNLLKKLKHLKSLDLSDNLLEEIHIGIFNDLTNLEDLNFSKNRLKAFDNALFKINPGLKMLNLSYNRINMIEHTIGQDVGGIIFLDLSHNNISQLSGDFFKSLPHLEYLDLSFNRIHELKRETFIHLDSLKLLDVNNNLLASLHLEVLPPSLVELQSGFNLITEIFYAPSELQVLNIEYNQISQIEANLTLLKELQHLNASGNMLSDFPNAEFKKLRTLDVSHNKLSCIPETISTNNLPALFTINVSKNPIRKLKVASGLKLTSFIANDIDLMEAIEEDTFSKLEAPSTACINFTISGNERLSFVHENCFQHLNVCSLDLSNNHIVRLSPKLIASISNLGTYGINLQGNPFNCNCSLQWILSELVPKLYSTRPDLLDNLRCALPSQISNMRMVHWYKWKGEVFCTDMSDFMENLTAEISVKPRRTTIVFEASSGLRLALSSAMFVFTVLVVTGLLLTHRQSVRRSRINRRF